MPGNYGYSSASALYFFHSADRRLRRLAINWPDALDGSIDITVKAGTGGSFGSWSGFWTGSFNDGSVAQHCDGPNPAYYWNYSCLGWTTSASSSSTRAYGAVGDSGSTSSWIHGPSNYLQCQSKFPLLCACRL
jgi:hypothetical protein